MRINRTYLTRLLSFATGYRRSDEAPQIAPCGMMKRTIGFLTCVHYHLGFSLSFVEFQRPLLVDPSQSNEGLSRTPDRRFSFKSVCLITIALMGRCADGWHVDAARDEDSSGGGSGDGGSDAVVGRWI
ncbi:hypothetical protein ALC53_05857 [Atta colombica]|uniref:Uncharacterized protein n=1 Tax=Atta colombica TaxID=520822 RepID=A0A151I3K7_9HYME|nr:hypothetical protein ALC53_05857 [Atta colombica]